MPAATLEEIALASIITANPADWQLAERTKPHGYSWCGGNCFAAVGGMKPLLYYATCSTSEQLKCVMKTGGRNNLKASTLKQNEKVRDFEQM